jgi:hypothetical protein
MRPVRIIAAVTLATAALATGSYLAVTTAHPSAATPTTPPVTTPMPPKPPVDPPQPPGRPPRVPVLADGRYNSYIRTIDRDHNRLVVDLVQVFQGQPAIDAAIADGLPHDQAQVLYVWVRNQNPRLRTLAMASDLQIDLLPGDCIESRNHQLAKLVKDSRAISNSRPAYYFTLTVADGAVHQIQEDKTFNAC